ncbi:MAG TPA: phage major capsid protein [Jiangellaceae bacterium]|nr:phage major capsid protein [Jiangellaceae bacterium]
MAKKRSEILSDELEILRAELKVIEEIEDPSDEDISRGDNLLAEWDEKEELRKKALEREAQVEKVFRAALEQRETESGDKSAPRGPEIKRTIDPFDNQELLFRSLMGDVLLNANDTISRAQVAIDTAPRHVDDAAKERMHELVELDNKHAASIARHMLLTGSPEYHDEFRDYVKSRGTMVGDAMRAAMSLSDSAGGYLVPFTLDPTIILTNAGIQDPLRQISTIKTITTDTWNGVTSAGVTAEWLAEGAEAADKSPTFGQPTITPKKAAAWVFGSYEVLADSGFANELGRLLADAKARLEGAAFATGNAVGQPYGVVTGVAAVTASIVTSTAINAYAVADVYRVSDALRPRDAAQASWVGNKKIFSLTRQFDTAGGSAFWANLGMGVPNQLLGQPIYEASTMTGTVTTSANILLAGNFSEFYIVDRVGMSVLYEPMVKSTGSNRPTGQAGWFAFWRVGSDVVDPDAFRLLQLHTTAAFTAKA